ncbi:MAG: ABC transporter ATP-binding protein [Polyangiales bacterium]
MIRDALVAEGLTHRWSRGPDVLRAVGLRVGEGEFVGVLGPNGAGKSTLLRACAGLFVPTAGAVRVGDRGLATLSARARAQSLAFVPQLEAVPDALCVRDYVSLGRAPWTSWTGRLAAGDRAAVDAALARGQLGDLADRALGTLSGGERRRCQVARALAQGARVTILDEPMASLDLHQQVALAELLRAIADEGGAVLAAMHEVNLAAQLCDRVVLLRDGAVRAEGPPAEALRAELIAEMFPCSFLTTTTSTGATCFVPLARRAVSGDPARRGT